MSTRRETESNIKQENIKEIFIAEPTRINLELNNELNSLRDIMSKLTKMLNAEKSRNEKLEKKNKEILEELEDYKKNLNVESKNELIQKIIISSNNDIFSENINNNDNDFAKSNLNKFKLGGGDGKNDRRRSNNTNYCSKNNIHRIYCKAGLNNDGNSNFENVSNIDQSNKIK